MSSIGNLPVPTDWSLAEQRHELLSWMSGVEAGHWCERCCRRFGLPPDMAGDVRSSAWIRLQRALDRRDRPFDDMSSREAAHRYAARTCENTAIDIARSTRRRAGVVPMMDEEVETLGYTNPIPLLESRLALEDLRRVTVEVARDGFSCSGCPVEQVLSSALWVINAQIIGDNGTMSDLLYESLQAVDSTFPEGRGDSARQRKSRCGRCVVTLLAEAIRVMEATR